MEFFRCVMILIINLLDLFFLVDFYSHCFQDSQMEHLFSWRDFAGGFILLVCLHFSIIFHIQNTFMFLIWNIIEKCKHTNNMEPPAKSLHENKCSIRES